MHTDDSIFLKQLRRLETYLQQMRIGFRVRIGRSNHLLKSGTNQQMSIHHILFQRGILHIRNTRVSTYNNSNSISYTATLMMMMHDETAQNTKDLKSIWYRRRRHWFSISHTTCKHLDHHCNKFFHHKHNSKVKLKWTYTWINYPAHVHNDE